MHRIACVAVILAFSGCASQPVSKGEPLPGQSYDDMKADVAKCTPPSNVGDVMLTGGIVASMMREREYKSCMTGKGYTAIPPMPKDPGPKSGG
jgi:hypothetical protein